MKRLRHSHMARAGKLFCHIFFIPFARHVAYPRNVMRHATPGFHETHESELILVAGEIKMFVVEKIDGLFD